MSRADTWMPLYIGDYLADTMSLEAREHGAYLLLIMHYWRNGPLPDDDRALAGIARVDRKTWGADTGPIVRAFFEVREGRLHHKRIDLERETAKEIADKRRAAADARWGNGKQQKGSKGGPGGQHEDSKPDARADANASTVDSQCTSHYAPASPSPSPSQSSSQRSDELPSVVARDPEPHTAARTGSRLPDDWTPGDDGYRFAEDLGLNPNQVLASFGDYWRGKAGKDGRKADWPATWRNWCRRDAERTRPPGSNRQQAQNRFAAWDHIGEQLDRIETHPGGRA